MRDKKEPSNCLVQRQIGQRLSPNLNQFLGVEIDYWVTWDTEVDEKPMFLAMPSHIIYSLDPSDRTLA